jgi:hypothetical protein
MGANRTGASTPAATSARFAFFAPDYCNAAKYAD